MLSETVGIASSFYGVVYTKHHQVVLCSFYVCGCTGNKLLYESILKNIL